MHCWPGCLSFQKPSESRLQAFCSRIVNVNEELGSTLRQLLGACLYSKPLQLNWARMMLICPGKIAVAILREQFTNPNTLLKCWVLQESRHKTSTAYLQVASSAKFPSIKTDLRPAFSTHFWVSFASASSFLQFLSLTHLWYARSILLKKATIPDKKGSIWEHLLTSMRSQCQLLHEQTQLLLPFLFQSSAPVMSATWFESGVSGSSQQRHSETCVRLF